MKFPYQDKKKKKSPHQPQPPSDPATPSPSLSLNRRRENSPREDATDGKEREGKKKTENKPGSSVAVAPRPGAVQSLNVLMIVLISALGFLVCNKMF